MNNMTKNIDPMDIYSQPRSEQETKLAKLFSLRPRQILQKPGRSLLVLWDYRLPLIQRFKNNYSYAVTFFFKGSTAGNHYHQKKREIFYPLLGDFRVMLEDIRTKQKEELAIKTMNHSALYIPTGIAHAVISKSDSAILLVTASRPSAQNDELEYPLSI